MGGWYRFYMNEWNYKWMYKINMKSDTDKN